MKRLPAEDLDHVLVHTGSLWNELRGQSVFFTGGTGFVGTWLLESLLWANDQLDLGITVGVLTRRPEAFGAASPHLAEHASVRLVDGDVRDFDHPRGQFTYVIHAATEQFLEPGPTSPLGNFDSNVGGTRHILEFARQCNAQRLLLTSSGAVYGAQPSAMTHMSEDYAGAPSTGDPATGYGQAKRASEFMSVMYGRAYGFEPIIARLFAFVGPLLPLNANYAIGNFIRDALAGRAIRVSGDGTPARSYLYAADMAIWLWTIFLRGKAAIPYNVGSPRELPIEELARVVAAIVAPGAAVEIAQTSIAGSARLRYVPETTRAANEFGLTPLISLEDAIRRTAKWYS